MWLQSPESFVQTVSGFRYSVAVFLPSKAHWMSFFFSSCEIIHGDSVIFGSRYKESSWYQWSNFSRDDNRWSMSAAPWESYFRLELELGYECRLERWVWPEALRCDTPSPPQPQRSLKGLLAAGLSFYFQRTIYSSDWLWVDLSEWPLTWRYSFDARVRWVALCTLDRYDSRKVDASNPNQGPKHSVKKIFITIKYTEKNSWWLSHYVCGDTIWRVSRVE